MNPSNTLNYLKKPFKKFSHLKLSKKNKTSDELPDISLESGESITKDVSGPPSLIGLRGELETAVTQYLTQVKDLGYYKESPRDSNNCKFTTFKAPTLPKKTGKKPVAPSPPIVNSKTNSSVPEDKLLDVKFQLINDPEKEEVPPPLSEESSIESQALDNPLYLSLSECSSGGGQKEVFEPEPFYQNSCVSEFGEEEHIYENVDLTHLHLYDTVTNPPRPKLPPKLSKNNSDNKLQKENLNESQTKVISDGSETSDLGSSGSEDTHSEEDWPLPPLPLAQESSSTDVPLPPPPPEIALEKLEEEVLRVEEEEKRQTLLRKKKKAPQPTKLLTTQKYSKTDISDLKETSIELNLQNNQPNIKDFVAVENKNTNEGDNSEKIFDEVKETEAILEEEFPSIRHSVVIELKESLKTQPITDSFSEKITDSQSPINTQDNGSVCVNIIQDFIDKQDSIPDKPASFTNQIIEISDDGSWEMRGKETNLLNADSGSSIEIDRFTGQPIMATLPHIDEPLEVTSPLQCKKEEPEPNIYFQDTATDETDFEAVDDDGVYSASRVETCSSMVDFIDNSTHLKRSESFPKDSSVASVTKQNLNNNNNLGAAIMEGYERDLKKKKDNLNLPDVSLFEFGDDVKELEMQRRDVIEQMTVKVKKKDSWIRTFRSPSDTANDSHVVKEKPTDEVKSSTENSETLVISQPSTKPQNSFSQFLGKTVKYAFKSNDTIEIKSTDQNLSNAKKKPVNSKFQEGFLGKCLQIENKTPEPTKKSSSAQPTTITEPTKKAEGEVDAGSILDKKDQTKSYWESKMLGVDDGGWEPVANVRFQIDGLPDEETSVPPPPEFSADNESQFESLSQIQDSLEGFTPPTDKINPRPSRQYMYGVTDENKVKIASPPVVRNVSIKTSSNKENVIEAEIREQQMKEEALRKQLRNREKGASSPSSHISDEGFVDRTPEEIPSPPSSQQGGFTHTINGANGEHIIYDSVSPPSEFFTDNTSDSETKIALEIRELKEREAELRAIREMREREQQLQNRMSSTRAEEYEEVEEGASSSSRETADDHLTSLTTTTDEGNFSEYGDPSSEDKSSDGSNSRIMSPDLPSFSSHAETRQRKPVSVKPFEDDEEQPQPVYERMKKESVIEREIRLAKEREEAYRREKGLQLSAASKPTSKSTVKPPVEVLDTPPQIVKPTEEVTPKRGVQHRIATNRIQQEIEETSRRERELQHGGQIKTLSEDTVDAKVTRLADLASEHSNQELFVRPQPTCSTSSSISPFSNGTATPVNKVAPSSATASPYTPPAFTPSPSKRPPAPTRLTRSLSTNNLSLGATSGPSSNIRAPQKGLMQKFFASRGKCIGTTFVASNVAAVPNKTATLTANGVPTRPMRVMPKAPVVRREVESKLSANEAPKLYKRTQVTAEEKIQLELREMKQREEELRRLRARNLARSQPNLSGLGEDDDQEMMIYSDGVDSSSFLHEMNGLRSALSNPNLLDDEEPSVPQTQSMEKVVRRRSALIAQWEGRIQQTTDTS